MPSPCLFSLALLLKINLAYVNNSVENTRNIGSLEHAPCLTRGKDLLDKYFKSSQPKILPSEENIQIAPHPGHLVTPTTTTITSIETPTITTTPLTPTASDEIISVVINDLKDKQMKY